MAWIVLKRYLILLIVSSTLWDLSKSLSLKLCILSICTFNTSLITSNSMVNIKTVNARYFGNAVQSYPQRGVQGSAPLVSIFHLHHLVCIILHGVLGSASPMCSMHLTLQRLFHHFQSVDNN